LNFSTFPSISWNSGAAKHANGTMYRHYYKQGL
jgi:hypothetical protein